MIPDADRHRIGTLIRDAVGDRGLSAVGYSPSLGFAAYARILHPMYPGDRNVVATMRWSDVADLVNVRMHRTIEWSALATALRNEAARRPSFTFDGEPIPSSLPEPQCRALCDVLARRGEDAAALFGAWAGYADLDPSIRRTPTVDVAYRETHVFAGVLDAGLLNTSDAEDVVRVYRAPNVWLAEDAHWMVTTELYATNTLVGGSADLISAIEDLPELEVLRIRSGEVLAVI